MAMPGLLPLFLPTASNHKAGGIEGLGTRLGAPRIPLVTKFVEHEEG